MPSIQIKDVPDETIEVLRRRAAQSHQSLQEYLLARLIAHATRPTLEEVLDRIAHGSGGTAPLNESAAIVRDDRDRR